MNNRIILSALAAVLALAIAGCGGDDSAESGSDVQGNGTDRAFVAGMIPHHESAIEMAKMARERGESPFVKNLAEDIIRTQTGEISTLRREDEGLETAGVEVGSLGMGMSMEMDMSMLETADPFDEMFMNMMIEHHTTAIEMAKIELDKGEDPELKALAQDVVDAQQREIDEMRKQLAQ